MIRAVSDEVIERTSKWVSLRYSVTRQDILCHQDSHSRPTLSDLAYSATYNESQDSSTVSNLVDDIVVAFRERVSG